MLIGIDGNEANVKNRVGSGVYALELLKQLHSLSVIPALQLSFPRPLRPRSEARKRESIQDKLAGIQKDTPKNWVLDPFGNTQGKQVENDKGINFIVYLKDLPLPDLPKESEHFRYKVFGPQKLWTQFALPLKLFFGEKPDVFFSMAHYGPRFSKIPYVITIHDLSYLHFPQMFKKNDLYQLVNWTKYSVKAAAHVIAVSETTKKDIIANYNIDPAKITVTYEGYDGERFAPQPQVKVDRVKKKYRIGNDYIIFVGTLQPRKNIERLIEAFAHITPEVKSGRHLENTPGVFLDDLQLVIVGKKGWLYDSIFQKVKDLHLEKKVIFTDYVPDDDLPALIGGARVYVLPSLWEGFGIPVIEAQASGVPVVTSNTSSLPEIVGDSGILIDPASAESISNGLKKVLTDDKLQSELVKKGFANIKRFSWQKCAQQTLDVLEKVALISRPIV